MLENARRQLVVVLLVALAAVLSLVFSYEDIRLGLDLRGGTQLIYEIDVDQAKSEGLIPQDASQEQVSAIIRETVTIIRERIDPTGTLDAVVQERGERGILIELPDMTEADARSVENLIQELGRLELRMVVSDAYANDDVRFTLSEEKSALQSWLDADDGANRKLVTRDPTRIELFNRMTAEQGGSKSEFVRWFPSVIGPSIDSPSRWGRSDSWVPTGPRTDSPAVPAFGAEEYNGGQVKEGIDRLVEFYPINMHEEYFKGEDLAPGAIRPSIDDSGRPCILYAMRDEQVDRYADWSDKYTGERSAIILNNEVHSAPVFEGRIRGNAQISGDFTQAQVTQLAKVLKTGSLKVRPVQQTRLVIGPTLGHRSIELGAYSIAAGGLLVLSFIMIYYRLAGLVAFVGIVLNIILILAAILAIRATLTLPGIAGLVLTMGMAVDANILIYERIREEIARGKELLQAARTGFDRAMVTILDANITTFIAGLVLYYVGVGPIRGFAVTLMIGIATTLFAAFFVSRLMFHFLLETRVLKEFKVAGWLRDVRIDFLRWSRTALTVSALVVSAGLINTLFIVPRDISLDLDFTGGANLRVVVAEPMTSKEITDLLAGDGAFAEDFPQPIVNTVGTLDSEGKATAFSVKLKLKDELSAEIDARKAQDPTYEPPYLTGTRRVLGEHLVADAYSEAAVFNPSNSPTTQFAEIVLHFNRDVKLAEVQEILKQTYGGTPEATARPPDPEDAEIASNLFLQYDVAADTPAEALFDGVRLALADLKGADGLEVSLSNPIPESEAIGGRMVGELRNAAIGSLLVAMFLIVMFIRVRFHEYKYGLAAVAALIHDVLVVLGMVVLANYLGLVHAEISLAMIAAFLTVIGYSINDTIVIFDRVRENLDEQKRLGEKIVFRDLVNYSISQTLSRTILTTTTTLFVLLSLFVVNYGSTTALEGFSFALIIGMISGTYSTIFIACPMVNWLWHRDKVKGGGSPADDPALTHKGAGAVAAQTGT